MHYHERLRQQLENRRGRIRQATTATIQNELRYFLSLIERTPYLHSLIQGLEAQRPDLTWPNWRGFSFTRSGRDGFQLPGDEIGAAKMCYGLVRECAEQGNVEKYANIIPSERSQTVNWDKPSTRLTTPPTNIKRFTEVFVSPVIDYLLDRVDTGDNVLYLLGKYKRRMEWFRRDELLSAMRGNPSVSEEIANRDLREYLFDQGIEYPFSEPSSPSGEADIVANLGQVDPLVLEIKLFDLARRYDHRYIRKGFRQIYDYANDYGEDRVRRVL